MRVDYLCKAIPGLKENKSIRSMDLDRTNPKLPDVVSCNLLFSWTGYSSKNRGEIRMAEFDVSSLDYFTKMYEKNCMIPESWIL